MIQLSRNYSLPEREDQIIPIKVIAVGSAGSNALDRVVLDGMDKSDLIAANTDVQSLASSVAAVKVQLGRSLTRGLGDRKSTRLNSSHVEISYAVFCLKKKKKTLASTCFDKKKKK